MRTCVYGWLLAALAALVAVGPAAATAPRASAPGAAAFVPGEVVVGFERGVDGRERAAARRRHGARALEALELPRTQLLAIAPGRSVRAAAAALERDGAVEYAEPNFVYRAAAIPNDTFFDRLWGLHNLGGSSGREDADVDAPEAWDVTTGADTVTVAVVDTGVDLDHPDLQPQLVSGWDFVHDDSVPSDLNGHGTHVAGTVGARGGDGAGVTGVAQRVKIMPLRALDHEGSGTSADVADAFAHAATNGAAVVNASLGGSGQSTAIARAIDGAPGALFVVAAGNDGSDNDAAGGGHFPCNDDSPNVLCVAASDRGDARASFSNWGRTSVDIAAPGVQTYSSYPSFAELFEERFEGGLGGWTGERLAGASDWAVSTDYKSEGDAGVAISPRSPYESSADTVLRTASPIDLTGREGCRLVFDLRLAVDSGGGDVFRLEAATASGGPWTTLYSASSDTVDSSGTAGFETVAVDLKAGGGAYDFYGAPVHLRLRFTTDGANSAGGPFQGAAVDWLELVCLEAGGGFRSFGGTSMATPHVAGAAALVLASEPALTVAQLKARLVDTGDASACWTGLTVSGRRLNAARALGVAESALGPGPTAASCGGAEPSGGGSLASEPAPDPAPSSPQPATEAPAPPDEGSGTGQPALADASAPVVRLALARTRRVASVVRRGLRARVSCSEECTIGSRLLVGRRSAEKLGLVRSSRRSSRYVTIARGRARLGAAGRRTVVTRASRTTRRRLSRLRHGARVRATLVIAARDDAGNRRTLRRRVVLRR